MDIGKFFLSALPEKGVLYRTPGQRAIGKVNRLPLSTKPQNQAEADLAGDIFHALYAPNVEGVESPPIERLANQYILEWAKTAKSYSKTRESTHGSPMAAAAATGTLWDFLTRSDVFAEAFAKQAEIEAKKKEAEELYKQAIEQAKNNMAKAKELLARSKAADDQANQMAQELAQTLGKTMRSGVGKGAMGAALQAAQAVAEDVGTLEMALGWGSGEAEISQTSLEKILRVLENNKEWIKLLAELAGRFANLARDAGKLAQVISPRFDVDYTRDLPAIMADEVALMVGGPDAIRAQKVAEFSVRGLMGFRPATDYERRGAFAAMLDESGSMGHVQAIVKAIGLGVSNVASLDHGRQFSVTSFGGWRQTLFSSIDNDSTPEQKLDWAANFLGGGTDFDEALGRLMRDIETLIQNGATGIDALVVTDDQGGIDPRVLRKWQKFKAENDVRLLLVTLGDWGYEQFTEIADRTLPLRDIQDANEIVKVLGRWLAE